MYGYSIAEWEMIEGQKQRAAQQAQMIKASSASANAYQEIQRAKQQHSSLYFDERNDTSFQPHRNDDLDPNLGDLILGIITWCTVIGCVIYIWSLF